MRASNNLENKISSDLCDLIREKGPTAIKRHFEM